MRQISDLWPGERFRMAGWNCVWRRWRYPTGLFVAVLAPDGAGKSTLIQHLRENLAGAFRRTEVFHLRPGVMGPKGTNGPVTDPHGKPLRSWWLSLLKIPYYLLDYGLGYLFKVRPRLVRSTLVLFDRYYDDLLVDPLRYRYGGPMGLARLARIFIPRPDLVLILDVGEEPLLARKQELSPEEVRRQREAYRQLATELPNTFLLDGSLSPEEVARNAREVVLDYLRGQHLDRRHFWFRDDGLETLNWLRSVLFAPEKARLAFSGPAQDGPETKWQTIGSFGWLALKEGRGYLITLDSRQAGIEALRLYNVQNLKARAAKKMLTLGLKAGVSWPLLRRVQVCIRRDVSEMERSEISLLDHLKRVLGRRDLNFAISLGTPGPHRKPVIQVASRSGKTLGYVKVGWNEATNTLVRNEADVSRHLSGVSFDSFTIPTLLWADWWGDHFLYFQSTPEGMIKTAPQELTSQYLAVLKELSTFHVRRRPLKEGTFWTSLLKRIDNIQNTYYRHILQQGLSRVEQWLGNTPLPFHLSHGDLAPWNAQLLNKRLFLFDWEYAKLEAPPGWDLFHFFVQTLQLLKRWSPVQICEVFQRNKMAGRWLIGHLGSLGVGEDALKPLFLMYLLERLSFYVSEDSTNKPRLRHLSTMVNVCMFEEKVLL